PSIRATAIAKPTLSILFTILFFTPIFAIIFYSTLSIYSKRKQWIIPLKTQIKTTLTAFLITLIFSLIPQSCIDKSILEKYEKRLPLASFLIRINNNKFKLNGLPPPPSDKDFCFANESIQKLEHKPNIYIFISEAFRADCINETTTPHLVQYQKDCLPIKKTLSNANATQISWFTIFHSQHAFHWEKAKHRNLNGALPLQILKNSGYKLHIFSSAELSYFHLDTLLFGKEKPLYDSFFSSYDTNKKPYIRDIRTIKALKSAIPKYPQTGQIFIIFLDSTHSEYSFPKNFNKFKPFVPNINYVKLLFTKKTIPLIKNRYLNAVNFIDTLFGSAISTLKSQNLYDSSLILFMGDHGEEFYENGAIFHSSHINNYQTNIPILYKFPNNQALPINKNLLYSSHIDIMPTILHYLYNKDFSYLFDGQSIFSNNYQNKMFCVKQAGGTAPQEFFILYNNNKLFGKFLNKNIYESEEIEISSIHDLQDQEINLPIEQQQEIIEKTFN
ncbi:MAG TPA: sulfatase-like hydrolase/transferase, partial [Chlamydiales bacterium]|nr:sulfatase-like hydrolase/transferase [Chlamydiales bacterium]